MKLCKMEAELLKLHNDRTSLVPKLSIQQQRHATVLNELQSLCITHAMVPITGSHAEDANLTGSEMSASGRVLFCAVSSQPADSGCPREVVHEASGHRLYFWTAIKSGDDGCFNFEPESVTWSYPGYPGEPRTAWIPYSFDEPEARRVWYSESP